jgi:anthranilate synthase/aminodeoxychorismate synthase-like glutamine amidotransferase
MSKSLTKPRVLMIDNYDSFTYNLVQYLGELGAHLTVIRNDEITTDEIPDLKPDVIVLSPGPGRPANAGITPEIVSRFSGTYPLLGVCLGHQAIGEVFGGHIIRAQKLMHGKTSKIKHRGHKLFAGITSPFVATRYHSLVVDPKRVPAALRVTARSEDGEIMGLAHRTHLTLGVQFHPESILTESGKRLLANFLGMAHSKGTAHA